MTAPIETATANRWTIGRGRDCDVVVDADAIETHHCDVILRDDCWTIMPRMGKVALADSTDASKRWITEKHSLNPNDLFWLHDAIALPWPCEQNALAILTIGRASDCDITISGASVSGRHAILIIGPRQTMVVRDLNSRNGLFVDVERQKSVAAVMLQQGHTLYFGSEPISADELIAKAELAQPPVGIARNEAKPAVPTFSEKSNRNRANKQRSRSSNVLKQIIPVFAPTLLLIGFLLWRASQSELSPTAESPTAESTSVERAMTAPAPLSDASFDNPSVSKSPNEAEATLPDVDAMQETITDVPKQAVEEASSDDSSVRSSLYWVLVRHDESNAMYRLGTGVAITDNTVLTTGSIIEAIDQMTRNGYSDPTVVQAITGKPSAVIQRELFPEFRKRIQAANAALAQYDQLSSQIESAEADAESVQSELTKLAPRVNAAMEAAAATDLGWLRVDEPLKPTSLDSQIVFRTAQSILAVIAAFDRNDPFFEPGEPVQFSNGRLRVTETVAKRNGFDGLLRLQFETAILGLTEAHDLNLIGTPLVRGDAIVAMIVYQSDSSTSAPVTIEAVPVQTLSTVKASIESRK